MKKLLACMGEVFTLKLVTIKIAMFVGCFLTFQSVAYATLMTYTFEGSFVLDNTTSIVGTKKGDIFDFRLTLDGSSVDTIHIIDEKPDGGLNMFGHYTGAVTGFEMMADPSNDPGSWDPSTLTYDLAGSTLLTIDVNPPDDPLDFMNEHLFVSIGVETADSPLHTFKLNLYNSTFYDPNATRQFWLDTSTPDNGFTLNDLFLHGMDTLSEFKSIHPWEGKSLVDSVFLDGGVNSDFPYRGTWGSGTVRSLAAVPEPATLALFGIGLAGLGFTRRKMKT